MVDLGAGFGRWLVKGATAVRQCHGDLPIRLIGVEAEPTHFEWLKQHFNDNGLDPAQHELIEAAVDGAGTHGPLLCRQARRMVGAKDL